MNQIQVEAKQAVRTVLLFQLTAVVNFERPSQLTVGSWATSLVSLLQNPVEISASGGILAASACSDILGATMDQGSTWETLTSLAGAIDSIVLWEQQQRLQSIISSKTQFYLQRRLLDFLDNYSSSPEQETQVYIRLCMIMYDI